MKSSSILIKMLKCYILIIKDEISDTKIDFSNDIDLLIRLVQEENQKRIASIANLVTSLGGVVDYKKEYLEKGYLFFIKKINIKVPEQCFDKLSKHPYIESISEV